jgi:Ni/Fe-hydrogenase subunit HybB-like protein
MMNKEKEIPMFSPGAFVLLALIALGAAAAAYRFANGLGAATNLSDNYPWGLWVAVDILLGVALAAGGFTITAAVYIFNLKKYKPIVKPAVLTAFIGYLMVVVGLFIDIGKPLSFWHPLVMWQHHSIMFEVVWCITLYTTVLAVEFAPMLLDKIGMGGLAGLLRKKWIVYPLVIAGITLSYLHQSSLGGFFLLVPHKLHKLWYTPTLPQLFYLSAIAVGLAMVSFESIVSSRVFKRGHETEILRGLAKGTAITLVIYLVVRLVDLAVQGNLALMFEGSKASLLFFIEIIGGVVLPMIILFSAAKAGSVNTIFMGQVLVIAGVVLNRFNANFLTQVPHGGSYFPTWMEFAVTIGLISLAVFLYRVAVARLGVFSHAEAGS